MNGADVPKRRSARLSAEGPDENEPPAKKSKVNGSETVAVSTKEQDGDSGAPTRKKAKSRTLNAAPFALDWKAWRGAFLISGMRLYDLVC